MCMNTDHVRAHKTIPVGRWSVLFLFVVVAVLAGCGEDDRPTANTDDTASATFDADGGTLTWHDVTVTVPEGAVAGSITMTVEAPLRDPARDMTIASRSVVPPVLLTVVGDAIADTISVEFPLSEDLDGATVPMLISGIDYFVLAADQPEAGRMRLHVPPDMIPPNKDTPGWIVAIIRMFSDAPEAISVTSHGGSSGDVAFVFVHGILSGADRWEDAGFFEVLASYGEIWTLEYPWYDHFELQVNTARAALEAACGDRRIVFVCHSKGGLLARAIIRANEEDHGPLDIQKAIFLGTPHYGAPLANLIEVFLFLGVPTYAIAIQIEGVTELAPGAPPLGRLNEPLTFVNPPRYLCVVGDMDGSGGDGIVPVASADLAHADHSGERESVRFQPTLATEHGHTEIGDYHAGEWPVLRSFIELPHELADCIAHWTFNGSAADVSGHGHHGQAIGVSWGTGLDGTARSAAVFDRATAGRIVVSPNSDDFNVGTGPWSVAMWVQPVSVVTAGNYWFVSKYGSAPGLAMHAQTHLVNGQSRFGFGWFLDSGRHYVVSTTQVMPGRWYHLVCQRTPAQLEIWVDGILEDVYTGADRHVDLDNANPLTIGALHDVVGNYDGKIDDMRVFSRHLTSQEIHALSDANSGDGH